MLIIFVLLCIFIFYNKPKSLVTSYLQGGFANRVFQVYAGQRYAEQYNKQFVIASNTISVNPHEEDDTTASLERMFPDVKFIRHIDYNDKKDYYSTPFKYLPFIHYEGNVVLHGNFQTEKYFPTRVPTIRTSYYPNTYFLHIRAGDYINSEKHYVNLNNYFSKCISLIKKADPEAKFLVFSNDNDYAIKYLKDYDIRFRISDKVAALDTLIEMSNCAGAICANSSLSWLGAYFQRKPRDLIYMPSRWINSDDDTRDLYPKWATIVNV